MGRSVGVAAMGSPVRRWLRAGTPGPVWRRDAFSRRRSARSDADAPCPSRSVPLPMRTSPPSSTFTRPAEPARPAAAGRVPRRSRGKDLEAVRGSRLAEEAHAVLVSDLDGRVVGYRWMMVLHLPADEGRSERLVLFLHDIAVNAGSQQSGVGTARLGADEDEARRQGTATVGLNSWTAGAGVLRCPPLQRGEHPSGQVADLTRQTVVKPRKSADEDDGDGLEGPELSIKAEIGAYPT